MPEEENRPHPDKNPFPALPVTPWTASSTCGSSKAGGIPVIFEKENIDTSNMNSEMILTCLSSFAQAESESISGNVTKGIRMGYRQGRFSFRYKNFLGYRKGLDGEPEIVPEEAKIIRLIAQNYLNGDSLRTIKETLESMGVPTATGNQNWSTEAIQRILQNEKYMGDACCRKPTRQISSKARSRRTMENSHSTTSRTTIRPSSQGKCFTKFRRKSPAGKVKSPPCQESQDQPWAFYQQIRTFGKTCLRELRLLFSKGDMEHPRTEANRLAMHQPAGMRAKGLQGLPQPQGR